MIGVWNNVGVESGDVAVDFGGLILCVGAIVGNHSGVAVGCPDCRVIIEDGAVSVGFFLGLGVLVIIGRACVGLGVLVIEGRACVGLGFLVGRSVGVGRGKVGRVATRLGWGGGMKVTMMTGVGRGVTLGTGVFKVFSKLESRSDISEAASL